MISLEPTTEIISIEPRQAPATVEADYHLHHAAHDRASRQTVGNRSEFRSPRKEPMYIGGEQVARRTMPAPIIRVQKLGLELGHIDVAGAFRFARLALQAQAHHVINPSFLQRGSRRAVLGSVLKLSL